MQGLVMAKYDYLVIGCGLTGAVLAQRLTAEGRKVLVIDKRPHIGGNCFTQRIEDIEVHKYGPHIFHTSNKDVWDYVNKFADFKPFVNRPKVKYKNRIYSFPINLMTLYQLWGVQTPQAAKTRLAEATEPIENPANLEEWVLSQVGREIYEIFIRGYTTKQWGKPPSELPADIIKRVPVRLNFDDNYYNDVYQGIPENGYTEMIRRMLEDIEIKLNCNYFSDRDDWRKKAEHIIYTGMIDEYFDYCFGELEYRSLRFEDECLNGDFQGNAVINYTDEKVPYTRIVEHKYFNYENRPRTVITREYPQSYSKDKIPYYPVNNQNNNELYLRYKDLAAKEANVTFAGRLGTYSYLDMDDAIEKALQLASRKL